MQLTKNFSLAEMTRTSQPYPNTPGNTELLNLKKLCEEFLQPLRDLLGKPIIVNSGYRSPKVNKAVGGVPTSYHQKGLAADIMVEGMTARELWTFIKKTYLPYHKNILEYEAWVHIQVSPINETPRHNLVIR